MGSGLSVGVLGATGAVGTEIVRLLADERWPISELSLYGSERSAGKSVSWRDLNKTIQIFDIDSHNVHDLVFIATNSQNSQQIAPTLTKRGTFVVDNTSAFRMAEDVPLVVPEINFDSIQPENRLIANPNCCTIILLMAVAPLRRFGKIKRVVVSTYQSASGAGREGMVELEESTRAYLKGEEFSPEVFPNDYAFNLFSHNTEIGADGYNGEETKMILETRKILNDKEIGVNPTCIRVPVLRSHSESITVEFEGDAPSESNVRECLGAFPGVQVIDDRAGNRFPMPNDSNGQGDVYVGRIRKDVSNPHAISLFVCGDQLLKGAALNAVQIGERLFGLNNN